MPRNMCHPDYVYRPWTQERRERARSASRRRLGIRDGCARIYGVDVPVERENPLRQYAGWVCQTMGWGAAVAFVTSARDAGWVYDKPSPDRILKTDPRYIYQARPRTLMLLAKRAERLAKKLARASNFAWGDGRDSMPSSVDWALVDELLSEHVSQEEVAAFVGITEAHLKSKLRVRKLSAIVGGGNAVSR